MRTTASRAALRVACADKTASSRLDAFTRAETVATLPALSVAVTVILCQPRLSDSAQEYGATRSRHTSFPSTENETDLIPLASVAVAVKTVERAMVEPSVSPVTASAGGTESAAGGGGGGGGGGG